MISGSLLHDALNGWPAGVAVGACIVLLVLCELGKRLPPTRFDNFVYSPVLTVLLSIVIVGIVVLRFIVLA